MCFNSPEDVNFRVTVCVLGLGGGEGGVQCCPFKDYKEIQTETDV